MEPNHSILVVEGKEDRLSLDIQNMKANLNIKRVDFREAREVFKNDAPCLVVMNLDHNKEEAKAAARALFQSQPETYGVVSAQELSAEEIVEFMRLGIKDFLKQPLNRSELQNLIDRMTEWNTQKTGGHNQDTHKLVSFFSSKGGVGVSTAAVNVAVGMAKRNLGRILLADFVLQHGNVAEFLDLTPQYTLLDLLENLERVDIKLLDHSLQKHRSGLSVLPHPKQPEESECFSPNETAEILQILKNSFQYVLLDLGHELNAATLSCLDLSDSIFLMTTPDFPSLYNAKRALETFKKLGYSEEKVRLVLNRWRMKGQIHDDLINKHIGYPIFHRLVEDPSLVLNSVNQGIPISELSKNSELTKCFDQLIEKISHPVNSLKKEVATHGAS